MLQGAYVLDCVRTPRARVKSGTSALSEVHPQELLAQALQALVRRNALDAAGAARIDDVIVGCVTEVGEQGGNLARNAVLAAELPDSIGGVTLNRYCGSALQAINFAALGVASGMQDLVIAGGVESMSRVPMLSDGSELDGKNAVLRKKLSQVPQGISADLIATLEGYQRHEIDQFAVDSQNKAAIAQSEGRFQKSMVAAHHPVSGEVLLKEDNHLRPDTTLETLGKLEPSFATLGSTPMAGNGHTFDTAALSYYPKLSQIHHVHTAGSASGIVDGAAAALLCSQTFVDEHGVKPRARIRSVAVIGSDPITMMTGPADVSMKALKLAGMSVKDIDIWEINEAFAAVPILMIRRLSLDPVKVNVNGGSIALGHPLGATGAILLGTAIDELERRDAANAVITLCIGGGQSIATVVERV